MKCKECKQKDELIKIKNKEIERVIKLNSEILNLNKSMLVSNQELIFMNKSLIVRIGELENKLKEATDKECSNGSNNA